MSVRGREGLEERKMLRLACLISPIVRQSAHWKRNTFSHGVGLVAGRYERGAEDQEQIATIHTGSRACADGNCL